MRSLTIAALTLGIFSVATAQIDSVKITERVFNDDADSTLVTTNNYPTVVSFNETGLDGDGTGSEFANRHVFQLSDDGGANAFAFTNDTFFEMTMDVTLDGLAGSTKEAGFLLDTIGGQGQFIVKSDGEIAAFGGPLPFHSFGNVYTLGDTVTLGIRYFIENGSRMVTYTAGGLSHTDTFTNTEQGIIDGSTLGGYAQFAIIAGNAQNFGSASFENMTFEAVPEPASMMALGLGAAALLRRRRR